MNEREIEQLKAHMADLEEANRIGEMELDGHQLRRNGVALQVKLAEMGDSELSREKLLEMESEARTMQIEGTKKILEADRLRKQARPRTNVMLVDAVVVSEKSATDKRPKRFAKEMDTEMPSLPEVESDYTTKRARTSWLVKPAEESVVQQNKQQDGEKIKQKEQKIDIREDDKQDDDDEESFRPYPVKGPAEGDAADEEQSETSSENDREAIDDDLDDDDDEPYRNGAAAKGKSKADPKVYDDPYVLWNVTEQEVYDFLERRPGKKDDLYQICEAVSINLGRKKALKSRLRPGFRKKKFSDGTVTDMVEKALCGSPELLEAYIVNKIISTPNLHMYGAETEERKLQSASISQMALQGNAAMVICDSNLPFQKACDFCLSKKPLTHRVVPSGDLVEFQIGSCCAERFRIQRQAGEVLQAIKRDSCMPDTLSHLTEKIEKYTEKLEKIKNAAERFVNKSSK